ncbi:hypothetical protein [Chryseobacterium phosphatilyticum]|nr:hypothetical protein [Chryseobacterium phosphatilyticum]
MSFLAFSGCKTDARKLRISTIYTEPERVVKEVPETDKIQTYTTRQEVTERLNPMILMLSKTGKILKFRIQGNISSGGHIINQIEKIRFEKGKQNGNSITLKYYTEITRKSGKESAGVSGYNYTKDEIYTVPDDVKVIKVELYEDQINKAPDKYIKLIAQQTFNFFTKI